MRMLRAKVVKARIGTIIKLDAIVMLPFFSRLAKQ